MISNNIDIEHMTDHQVYERHQRETGHIMPSCHQGLQFEHGSDMLVHLQPGRAAFSEHKLYEAFTTPQRVIHKVYCFLLPTISGNTKDFIFGYNLRLTSDINEAISGVTSFTSIRRVSVACSGQSNPTGSGITWEWPMSFHFYIIFLFFLGGEGGSQAILPK